MSAIAFECQVEMCAGFICRLFPAGSELLQEVRRFTVFLETQHISGLFVVRFSSSQVGLRRLFMIPMRYVRSRSI